MDAFGGLAVACIRTDLAKRRSSIGKGMHGLESSAHPAPATSAAYSDSFPGCHKRAATRTTVCGARNKAGGCWCRRVRWVRRLLGTRGLLASYELTFFLFYQPAEGSCSSARLPSRRQRGQLEQGGSENRRATQTVIAGGISRSHCAVSRRKRQAKLVKPLGQLGVTQSCCWKGSVVRHQAMEVSWAAVQSAANCAAAAPRCAAGILRAGPRSSEGGTMQLADSRATGCSTKAGVGRRKNGHPRALLRVSL